MGREVLLCTSICLAAALVACGDGPDRIRHAIPANVSVGETLYYRTKWFECAVAIYRLKEPFLQRVRTEGIVSVKDGGADRNYREWKETPVLTAGDDYYQAVALHSLGCLEGAGTYSDLVDGYVQGHLAGYYAVSAQSDVAIVAPNEGLLLLLAE